MTSRTARLLAVLLLSWHAPAALAWGDEGHAIVALIGEHYLTPRVRARVFALLAADSSGLARSTGIADEAAWADKFRDSDRSTSKLRYEATGQWHFVDIEIDAPDLDAACFQHPVPAPETPALQGPAADCIVDKIDEFRGELRRESTPAGERLLALQFLLHFLGDVHQPLHAADHHDRGGNDVRVVGSGAAQGSLHHYWDTEFVRRLGTRPEDIAGRLIARISPAERRTWSRGSARSWALESFAAGKRYAYRPLAQAAVKHGAVVLDHAYETDAERVVARQLQRAGVRLALVLNRALGVVPSGRGVPMRSRREHRVDT